MGKGKLLSDFEKGQILAKKEEGLSNRRIARDLGRSHAVVNNFVRNPAEYGTKRSTGRHALLSERDKRRILREASNSTKSCPEIKSSLKLNVSRGTVWSVIKKSEYIVGRKMRKAPFMTEKHRDDRVAFAKNCIRTDWSKVVFSDEKKFNCDGPDGNRFYWHDLRKDKLQFSRRNFKGGGVMEPNSGMGEFKKKLSTCEKPIRKELTGVANFLFQGDIDLSTEQQREVIANLGDVRSKRQAYNDTTCPGRRWYKGLFFSLDGNLPEELMIVYRGYGCWSKVGRQGDWQFMSLGDGCGQIGVATHEIGHALGFWHTQSRYDRDEFTTVLKENINTTYLDEFLKQTMEINNNYGLTYDYGSLMHYGAKAVQPTKPQQLEILTMVPTDVLYTDTLGSDIIAFYDLLMMNMYYNCTDTCKEAPTRCHNDGFPHPRNCSKCICPSGYGGQLRNEKPRGRGEVLRATKWWKSLKGEVCRSKISTDGFMRCNYWIEAPSGKKVKVKLVELPGFEDDGCVKVGVEIKTHPDQRRTGYRFCSSAYIHKTLTSASSRVPVIFYKKYESKTHITRKDPIYDYEDGGGFFGNDEDGREEEEQIPTGITIDYRYV